MTDHPEHGTGLQDNTELLHRISARLADRFAGVFAAETVERYVFESYTALARTAKIKTYLPSTTEHFANRPAHRPGQVQGRRHLRGPRSAVRLRAERRPLPDGRRPAHRRGQGQDPRPVRRLPPGGRTGPRRRRGDVRNGPGPDQGLPQAPHRRRGARLRRRDHHGLRRLLPDLPRQTLRGLGAGRPGRPARCGRADHP